MTASADEILNQPAGLLRHERNRARGQVGRLPRPIAQLWAWQEEGACRDAAAWLFFHPEGERGPSRAHRARAAVAVCATCPVIEACREHALAAQEPYGVWGGLTEEDRARLLASSDLQPAGAALLLVGSVGSVLSSPDLRHVPITVTEI